MAVPTPKQFLPLAGKPILAHSVEHVLALDQLVQVVIALPAEHIPQAKSLLSELTAGVPILYEAGGATRQESVSRAVSRVPSGVDIILVHDAVRPVCTPDLMQSIIDAAWQSGAAVPAVPATDTIQRVSRRGRIVSTPPREELYAIQTPQCFHADLLRAALEQAAKAGYVGTDESSIVRWAGHPVFVVPGSPSNIKITRPLDVAVAELLLSSASDRFTGSRLTEESTMRVGHGIDYHSLVEGRKLILGGVEIPFEKGLQGHSDADALAHAVCDALLGAAGLGDIGRHFPDNDPRNRNRSSGEFLREVRAMISDQGWVISNVDVTVLAERPRLAPHMDRMKSNVAECLGMNVNAVNIKATTTEGMNAEGRGEGISAHAIALLKKR